MVSRDAKEFCKSLYNFFGDFRELQGVSRAYYSWLKEFFGGFQRVAKVSRPFQTTEISSAFQRISVTSWMASGGSREFRGISGALHEVSGGFRGVSVVFRGS